MEPAGKKPLPKLSLPRSGRGADFAQQYGRAPTEKELQYGRPMSSGAQKQQAAFKNMKEANTKKSPLGTAENPNNVGLVPLPRVYDPANPQPILSLPTAAAPAAPAAPPVPKYDDPTGAVLGYRTGTTSALGGGMGINEDQYSVRRRLLGA